ncbi:hypothetical protein RISK_003013 [Rhodopirellula islandica]|uniref:Uncharacterized protein n=1 Tax=Rhodopirellula islandica TaxID=595434 RepID=A0A0J1BDY5_RHOIS|nr:hypothetical protein RISK_003013 [Rhodopirellula islandica]
MLPRTTGANAQTAHMMMPDHSCRPAEEVEHEFQVSASPRCPKPLDRQLRR